MSIFSAILGKIFPPSHPAVAATASAPPVSQAASSSAPSASAGSGSGTPDAPSLPPVDVDAVLNGMANESAEKLNWQSSIVDLMKLLDLDSSHEARLALAKELNYTGDTADSAAMNIWLHRAVMQKLADNGGIVPDSLKH